MTPTDPTMTQTPKEPGDASEAAWDAGMAAAFGPGDGGENRPAGPGAGTVLGGKFTLTELIGEGGMGSVWVAHQTEPVKRKVAVKLIKAGMDSATVLARFEAERQALAVMDHPNIAKVLDGGLTPEGRPFFVMELVKGMPITEYCDARRLTPRERLELFVPVCQAIQHAHQKGVIHRDVKPANVLVALYDDKPVPKVIDFGIAKATGGTLSEQSINTAFGGVVGTPQYMSPEQASLNNLDIDTRSDVYSLGVLLYELLTGSPPFAPKELEKRGLLEILRVVREEEPPRPSTKLSTADALPSLSASRGTEPKKLTGLLRNELDWIVMKALEKDRGRRYETANGFAADVTRYLSGEAVLAHPPSLRYRYAKFSRRNRREIFVAYFLFACSVAFVGSLYSQIDRARTAEKQAVAAQQAETERAEGERLAKVEAQAKEAEANAVVTFLEEKVFAAARPKGEDGGLGAGVTLRDALTASVPALAKGFAGQPLVEARLRRTLGLSLWYLGDYKNAVVQCGAARALFAAHRGPGHPDTLLCLNYLATCHQTLGRHADALKLREERLAVHLATFGPTHPDTLWSMHDVALSYTDLGRHADALKLNGETLALRAATLGPSHHSTLQSMMSLAGSYSFLGRPADALPINEQVLNLLNTQFGPDHPGTLWGMYNLANSYDDLGRPADALKLHEETLALRNAKLGHDHPDTLSSRHRVACHYSAVGRPADARRLHEETLAARRRALPPDHPDTLTSMYTLAGTLIRLDRGAEAIPLLDEFLAKAGADSRLIPMAISLRGQHFQKAGDPAGCRATAERCEKRNRTDAGSLYVAARLRAVAAAVQAKTPGPEAAGLAKADEDRAMQWLHKAVQAGYQDAAHMKTNYDLKTLRGRDDFKKLVAEMEAKPVKK